LWRGKAGGGELPTRFELVSIAAAMQTRSRKVEMPSGLSLPLAFAIYTVVEVGALLDHGHPEVVDADLADYFGSIPHAELLKSVARRIVDRRVLHLIKMWLDCPVEETDDRGRKTRTTEARDNRRAARLTHLTASVPLIPKFAGCRKGLRTSEFGRLVAMSARRLFGIAARSGFLA
jgi:hypothetical protein